MTERSYFWDGAVTGDAGAYTPNDLNHFIWLRLFGLYINPVVNTSDLVGSTQGVIKGIDNELLVQGATSGVSIASGSALVDGSLYKNTSSKTLTDNINDGYYVVLRKDFFAQTIRLQVVLAPKGQFGFIWDLPLARIGVSGNVVTVGDNRIFTKTPLIPAAGQQLIETITLTSARPNIQFSDIPQTYKHLKIIGQSTADNTRLFVTVNNLTNQNSYNNQYLGREPGDTPVSSLDQDSSIGEGTGSAVFNMLELLFANYRISLYPTFFGFQKNASIDLKSGIVRNTTKAINSIQIRTFNASDFLTGTTFSLYGIL